MRRLLLVFAVLGCSKPVRPVEVRPDPVSIEADAGADADVGAEAATEPPKLCAGSAAKARRTYEDAAHRWLGDAGPTTRPLVGTCLESPAGAWWFDLPDLSAVKEPHDFEFATEGRFILVFEPREGKPVRFVAPEVFYDYGQRILQQPWIFDFDHDGVPELFVDAREEGEEGHRASFIQLFTFRGGAIKPYDTKLGMPLEGSRDIDGDGRPDLLVAAGYTESLEGCASGFSYDYPTPAFAAHALADGTFSLDDAQAKAFAKVTCPAPPTKIASSTDAMCARLWATDPKKERARVVSSCLPWSCPDDVAGKPQKKGATEDCARRVHFFDRLPPLTLP